MSMDEARIEALSHDPAARARWVHDLRNALNVLGVGTRLAQRMIEKGEVDDAVTVLADSMRAWTQCNALLDHAGEATSLVALPRDSRAIVAERARPHE